MRRRSTQGTLRVERLGGCRSVNTYEDPREERLFSTTLCGQLPPALRAAIVEAVALIARCAAAGRAEVIRHQLYAKALRPAEAAHKLQFADRLHHAVVPRQEAVVQHGGARAVAGK